MCYDIANSDGEEVQIRCVPEQLLHADYERFLKPLTAKILCRNYIPILVVDLTVTTSLVTTLLTGQRHTIGDNTECPR